MANLKWERQQWKCSECFSLVRLVALKERSGVLRCFSLWRERPRKRQYTVGEVDMPNPVSRDFVLMHTNVNLLNRVPEHDYQTFFLSPMFPCYTERNVNQCKTNAFFRREREIVRTQYGAPSSYISVNINDFFKQTSSKTEANMLHNYRAPQNKTRERKREREGEREKGFRRGVCRYNALLMFVSKQ